MRLAQHTHLSVIVCVKDWSANLPFAKELESAGCRILARAREADEHAFHSSSVPVAPATEIVRAKPDLVVISHGDNREGMPWMEFCAEREFRYVSIAHRASEADWPDSRLMGRLRNAYLSAWAVHFVSVHNWHLTERMICAHLPTASVVRNPFNVPYDRSLPWPPDADGFRMACVARLDLESKAQDVLLDVLADRKWRQRPLTVEIVGREGPQSQLLRELCDFLDLNQVKFVDMVKDIRSVWARCHALVLPSRKEGLPVSVIEAMLSGRPALVTDVGGCREVVLHGRTGWVADSPTRKAFDAALESAWTDRRSWQSMGSAAARTARSLVPADPVGAFAGALHRYAVGLKPAAVPDGT